MAEESQGTETSRREFLKRTLKTSGYVLPTIMVVKLSTVDAWAQSYNRDQTAAPKGSDGDGCNGFFEKIFESRCWR